MSGTANTNRELLFCHQCEDEWYRDDRGLVCPRCRSEIVEIIQPDTDPREEHFPEDDQAPHNHPLHDHNPWGGDAPDPDEDDVSHVEWTGPSGTRFSRITMRSNTPNQMPPGFADAFGPIFGVMMGNMPPPNVRPDQNPQNSGGGNTGNRGPLGNTRIGGTYTFSMNGPGNVRFSRTGGNLGMEDLNGIMGNLLGMFGPQAGAGRARGTAGDPGGDQQNAPINPVMRMLMDMAIPPAGAAGDVAYTQEGFDRIMTMLREQHQGSNAPGPANEAAIEALPKIKLAKEQLDDQGKADCAICMDSVEAGAEVTKLPCEHWFHGDCITSWLKEHDTCPQCRRGITPKEGDETTPRTTGQAPRYWQVDEGDINALAREASNSSQAQGTVPDTAAPTRRSSRRRSRSPASSPSNRSSRDGARTGGVSGFLSGLGRRFGNGGHNDGGGSHH